MPYAMPIVRTHLSKEELERAQAYAKAKGFSMYRLLKEALFTELEAGEPEVVNPPAPLPKEPEDEGQGEVLESSPPQDDVLPPASEEEADDEGEDAEDLKDVGLPEQTWPYEGGGESDVDVYGEELHPDLRGPDPEDGLSYVEGIEEEDGRVSEPDEGEGVVRRQDLSRAMQPPPPTEDFPEEDELPLTDEDRRLQAELEETARKAAAKRGTSQRRLDE